MPLEMDRLYVGDAGDLFPALEANSVDLLFTDPPYSSEYFSCYELLAEHAQRVLKPGGSLVTIIPHYALERVMLLFAEQGNLKWRWLLCMDQSDGAHARMAMGIEVCFKPMGWWVKGSWPTGRGFVRDSVKVNQPTKKLHKWQQSIDWARYYIERLCPPGGVVVDPYVGAGTSVVACVQTGRHYLGFDIDPVAIEISRLRLEGEVAPTG